ncbi:hypothetical protein V8G54_032707 [Vigna mungo]|uniref:Uncharacterized protein n=1 Tax=Vigna mungo TaxID=3915 RepID=A0AAQ3MMY6_VIGMU
MKKHVDARRRHVTYPLGDWIIVKLSPHRQQSVSYGANPKLTPCYYGYFQVLLSICLLLMDPKPDDSLMPEIAHTCTRLTVLSMKPLLPVGHRNMLWMIMLLM